MERIAPNPCIFYTVMIGILHFTMENALFKNNATFYFLIQLKIKLDKVYLHNRDSSDRQNMPNSEKIKEIKQAYFNSISDILDNLKPSDLKKVYIMHDFECAYSNIQSGNFKNGFFMLLGILKTPTTFYLAINRCFRRIVETHNTHFLQKKYSIRG